MKRFDSINIGDKAKLTHKITRADIEKFVDLTGDDNKLHVDDEYAQTTSFKKPVAHGMLGASFISTIIGTKLPGDGALWYSQSLEFLLPVRIGDTITVKAEVIKKLARQNSIELQVDIFNQHKQKVTTGISKVKIVEEESEVEGKNINLPIQKVALIIGASGGIGKASALKLSKDGFAVILHYYSNKQSVQELKGEIESIGGKAILVKGNITIEEDVKEIFSQINRYFNNITVLVNCSTIKVVNTKFNALSWGDIQKHFDINIKGSFLILKYLLPIMEKAKYGKIIHLTTQYTDYPVSELLAYISAKSALNGWTKALAFEYAPKGIRVNSISPGMTDTDLIADIPKMVRLTTAAKTPLRRLAKVNDIAGAISFLASEESDFITGEIIRVNGGQVMI